MEYIKIYLNYNNKGNLSINLACFFSSLISSLKKRVIRERLHLPNCPNFQIPTKSNYISICNCKTSFLTGNKIVDQEIKDARLNNEFIENIAILLHKRISTSIFSNEASSIFFYEESIKDLSSLSPDLLLEEQIDL